MSRIGKKPVDLPTGVIVDIKQNDVTVKGKLGEITREFHHKISINLKDSQVIVKRPDDSNKNKALHGLTRALLANMVQGVTEGFSKRLLIEGVGYRCAQKGKGLEFLLGYSHPIMMNPPDGVEFEVIKPTELIVKGIDKEKIGQIAANIRNLRPPEPYKGKGIRFSTERIRRKAGKAAAKK
ncbi:MAG: 50S ribosomal protein L6 [Nitrospinota bacterium]